MHVRQLVVIGHWFKEGILVSRVLPQCLSVSWWLKDTGSKKAYWCLGCCLSPQSIVLLPPFALFQGLARSNLVCSELGVCRSRRCSHDFLGAPRLQTVGQDRPQAKRKLLTKEKAGEEAQKSGKDGVRGGGQNVG
jgi:hypothetical protein